MSKSPSALEKARSTMSAFAAYMCTRYPAPLVGSPAPPRVAMPSRKSTRAGAAGIGIGDHRTRFGVAASSGERNAAGGSGASSPWEEDARTRYSHTREFSAFRTVNGVPFTSSGSRP